MNSYQKGARAEREIARLLEALTNEHWQRTGMPERYKLVAKGDVNPVIKLASGKTYINQRSWYYQNLQIDVKKRTHWDLLKWYQKLAAETDYPKRPIILVSRNNTNWYAFLAVEDLFTLLKEFKNSYDGKKA